MAFAKKPGAIGAHRGTISVAIGCVLAATAVQAPAQSGQIALMQEVVVTGTHIRRTDYDASTPITFVDREDIIAQGASSVLDIARYLPVNTGSILNQESGELVGTTQFNLRGMGLGSTLTLVNGRRAGKSAVADDVGNQYVDINQFPLSMIERIDVQTDGASAIYGSEAVGGVVNIITRKGMEGFEISLQGKSATNEAGSLSIAAGAKTDTVTANLYATYYYQSRSFHEDLDWHLPRLGLFSSSTGSPGNYRLAVLDVDGNFVRASGTTRPDPDCEAALGILSNNRCRYPLWNRTSPIPREDRLQVFAEAEAQISDSATAYTEFHYSNNVVGRVFGPSPYSNGKAGGSLLVPANHPFNFWVSDGATGIQYIPPSTWDNNIHQAVPIVYLGRPLGAEFNGPGSGCDGCEYDLEFHLNYFRALLGGKVQFAGDWTADASYTYNRSERVKINAYQFHKQGLEGAVESGAFNPFGTRVANPTLVSPKDGTSVSGLTKEVFDTFHLRDRDNSLATQEVADLVVAGAVGQLAGGEVGLAFGGQLRKEHYELLRDPLRSSGLGDSPETEVPFVEGDQDVSAVFAEVLLPFRSNVEVSAAVRYEDYGGNIGATTDPKVTARWQITDPVAVRASYGTSFQAPTAFQTSTSIGSEFLSDPASLNAQGQLVCVDIGHANNTRVVVGGDEGLSPQSADNFNLGLIVEPIESLRVSLDYWSFKYTDLIRPNASAQALVDNDCRDDGIPNDPRIIRGSSGNLSRVNLSFINTGELNTNGIDIHAVYELPATAIGNFTLDAAASYVNEFDITNEDGSKTDGAGSRNFGNPFPSVPELRGNLRLAWSYGAHSAFAALRYIDSYTNDQPTTPIAIPSWMALDLRYTYAIGQLFGGDARVSIGSNNVFDKPPSTLGQGERPGYDDEVADVRGRILYAEMTIKF